MLFIQKTEQFGNQFFEDYVKIMELETPEKVKEFINGINDQWRKILMAIPTLVFYKGKKSNLILTMASEFLIYNIEIIKKIEV